MSHKNEHSVLWLAWIVFVLWLLYLVVSIWWYVYIERESVPNILFQVINILFSGIALIVAYISMARRSKDMNKRTEINTIIETVHGIVESDKFCENRAYILSRLYDIDIDNAKRLLGRNNICIDDIKNLCSKKKNSRLIRIPVIEDLCASYEKIIYICSMMEYVGVLYEKDIASDFIIMYYGELIVETYEKIQSILCDPKRETIRYPHYTKMYNDAKLRFASKHFIEKIKLTEKPTQI